MLAPKSLDFMSQLPKGYKQTEIGVIPEDWDVQAFQDVAILERGKFTARPRNDPKYYGGDIPFIQTGDVANSNGNISTFSQTLNQEGLKVSKLFSAGTIFLQLLQTLVMLGLLPSIQHVLIVLLPLSQLN